MKKYGLTWVLFFVAGTISSAAEPLTFNQLVEADRVRMTVKLLPSEEVIVTQKVILQIELSTDRWFLGGTRIDELEIRNVIVPRRSEFAVNSTRREQGTTWTVQQWDIDLYPSEAGTFTIPPLEVQITVSGDDNQPIKGSFSTNELSFSAMVPEALKQQAGWFASNNASLKESWDAAFDDLKTGDALTRTLTMEAEGIPAMMLPGILPKSAEGMTVYPKSTDIQDKTTRGESKGVRIDEVTYFFEQAGTYTLPEQQFTWWNLETAQVETLTLKERTFKVATSPSEAEQFTRKTTAESDDPFPIQRLLTIGIISIVVLWMVYRLRNSIRLKKRLQYFNDWRNRPPSEKDYWRKCIKTADVDKAEEILAALYAWLDRGLKDPEIKTLEAFAKRFGDAELVKVFRDLNRMVYMPDSTNKPGNVFWITAMNKARKTWKRNRTQRKKAFQPLNP